MRISRFNINEQLSNSKTSNEKNIVDVSEKGLTFEQICEMFNMEFAKEVEQETKDEEREKLIQTQHNGILGTPSAITVLMGKIENFLNNHNIHEIELPIYYKEIRNWANPEHQKFSDLSHAIYHDVFGHGPIAYWKRYPDSYACQIIGKEIYMTIERKKQRMPFEFQNEEQVQRIIRSLTFHHEQKNINKFDPTMEVDLFTGERVTVMIPPRVKRPVITFRRFLLEFVSLEILIAKGLFPAEALPVVRALSTTHSNLVIAGPPGTGKSTLLKALFNERDRSLTTAIVEKHYELAISRDYPGIPIIEVTANEKNFHYVFDELMRTDLESAIIGEIRRVEVEGYMLATERLPVGSMTTYHLQDVTELPAQWARLLLDLFPTRKFDEEMGRVASKIDFVIELNQSSDKKIRIKSIQEMRYNAFTHEISTHYIMRYNKVLDQWEYNDQISEEILNRMDLANSEETNEFQQSLKELSQKYPLTIRPTVYYNPIEKQPLQRVANSLENLDEAIRKE